MIAIEGNGSRPSHSGDGWSETEVMYTLNSTEVHAVAFDARGNGGGEIVNNITGDHNNRVTDYTTVILQEREYEDIHE